MNYINYHALLIDDHNPSKGFMALGIAINKYNYYYEFNDYDFGDIDNPEKVNLLLLLEHNGVVNYKNDSLGIYYNKDSKENVSHKLISLINKHYSIFNGDEVNVVGDYTAEEFLALKDIILLDWRNNVKEQFKENHSDQPFKGLNFKMVTLDGLKFMLKNQSTLLGSNHVIEAVDTLSKEFDELSKDKSILLKMINTSKLFEALFSM